MQPSRAELAFAVICLVWGTTFLGVRIAIVTIPTLYVTGARFVLAGAILLAIALLRGERLPRDRQALRDDTITSLLLVPLGNGLTVWSQHFISSALTALFAAAIPLWTAVLETFFFRGVTFGPRRVAGLLIGFAGVATLAWPGPSIPEPPHDLLRGAIGIQLAAAGWSAASLRLKRAGSAAGGMMRMSMQMLPGGAIVLLAALITAPSRPLDVSLESASAVLYLAIFSSVLGYGAFHYALRHMSASRVMLYAYVTPIVAMAAGALILGESITLRMIAGAIVILSGVALARSATVPPA